MGEETVLAREEHGWQTTAELAVVVNYFASSVLVVNFPSGVAGKPADPE